MVTEGEHEAAVRRAGPAGRLPKWPAAVAFLLVLWVGRDILPPFIVAGVLAYILSRPVDWLTARLGVRRVVAALLVLLGLVIVLGLGVWLLESRLAPEIGSLSAAGPDITRTIVESLTGGQTIAILGQQITPDELTERLHEAALSELPRPGEAVHVVTAVLHLALWTLLALVVLAYLLIDGAGLGRFLLRFVPEEHCDWVTRVAEEIHCVLGRYLRGQIFLVALMSTVTFVGLQWVFHLPYALPISIATGLLELIPFIGPISAAAIACAVGFVQGGPSTVGGLALFYFVLRQLEDYLVMPRVVSGAVHVHPAVTIFAVLVGERVAGALGMLLAVPVAAAVKVILDYAYPPASRGEGFSDLTAKVKERFSSVRPGSAAE
jgi:predicted PurR-regulated permease PerM